MYYKYLGMVESFRRTASVDAHHDLEKTELLRLLAHHIFSKHLLDANEIFSDFSQAKIASERYRESADADIRQAEREQYQQALQACEVACTDRLNAHPVDELRLVYECGRELGREIAKSILRISSASANMNSILNILPSFYEKLAL